MGFSHPASTWIEHPNGPGAIWRRPFPSRSALLYRVMPPVLPSSPVSAFLLGSVRAVRTGGSDRPPAAARLRSPQLLLPIYWKGSSTVGATEIHRHSCAAAATCRVF